MKPYPHSNSLSAILDPHGTSNLDQGDTAQNYKQHIPVVYDLAAVMLEWLAECSYVQIESSDSKPKKLFPPTYKENNKSEPISQVRISSVLLGRKRFQVSNNRIRFKTRRRQYSTKDDIRSYTLRSVEKELSVKWFLQPVPFLNRDTGELLDEDVQSYIDAVINAGYLAIPYRLSSHEHCVLVVLGEHVAWNKAKQICEELATSSSIVVASKSSLFTCVPAPLSLNSSEMLCSWINSDLAQSKAIFKQIIGFHKVHHIAQEIDLEGYVEQPALEEQKIELATVPDLNDKPYFPPTDWIVEASLRQQLIEFLGVEDKNALKMLGLYLFGRKCKIFDSPIADETTIAALFGWQKKSKNNKPIVGPALKLLHEHTKVDENPSSYRGISTSFKLPDLPQKIINSSKTAGPYVNPVLLGTGARIREFVAKRTEQKLHAARLSVSNYPNQTTDNLLDHLNNLPTNYFQKITNEHMREMLSVAEQLEGESKYKALSTLRYIQLYPKPIYKKSRKTCRIYTIGSSYQYLSKSIRNIAFRGNLKVDLRHSQLSIACFLYGYSGLNEHLENETLWDYLMGETGLSKGQLKSILYTSFYMSAKEFNPYSNPALRLPDIEISDVKKFGSVKEIQELMEHRTAFIHNKLDFVQEDVFKNKFQDIPFNEKLAALSQCLELTILSTSIDYVLGLKDNQISLFLHDGFFIKGDSSKFYGIAEKIKSLVNERLEEFGIISGIEVTF